MKILVCIKQVPDTEAKIKPTEDQREVQTDSIKWIINPYDEFAIEEALKIKSQNSESETVALCVGNKATVQEALRTALAMGIDRAIAIHAPQNVLSQPLPIAKALKHVIEQQGDIDLILMGKIGIDYHFAQTPYQLAKMMDYPVLSGVTALTLQDKKISADVAMDDGLKQSFECSLPAIVGANKGLNTPRYPSLPGIIKAKKKPLEEITWESLGVESTPSPITKYIKEEERPPVEMISGDEAQQAEKLASLLQSNKLL